MTSKTFVSGTVIDSAWLNDVNDTVYAAPAAPVGSFKEALAASSGASLVGYIPDGVGAVPTDVEARLHQFDYAFGALDCIDAPAYGLFIDPAVTYSYLVVNAAIADAATKFKKLRVGPGQWKIDQGITVAYGGGITGAGQYATHFNIQTAGTAGITTGGGTTAKLFLRGFTVNCPVAASFAANTMDGLLISKSTTLSILDDLHFNDARYGINFDAAFYASEVGSIGMTGCYKAVRQGANYITSVDFGYFNIYACFHGLDLTKIVYSSLSLFVEQGGVNAAVPAYCKPTNEVPVGLKVTGNSALLVHNYGSEQSPCISVHTSLYANVEITNCTMYQTPATVWVFDPARVTNIPALEQAYFYSSQGALSVGNLWMTQGAVDGFTRATANDLFANESNARITFYNTYVNSIAYAIKATRNITIPTPSFDRSILVSADLPAANAYLLQSGANRLDLIHPRYYYTMQAPQPAVPVVATKIVISAAVTTSAFWKAVIDIVGVNYTGGSGAASTQFKVSLSLSGYTSVTGLATLSASPGITASLVGADIVISGVTNVTGGYDLHIEQYVDGSSWYLVGEQQFFTAATLAA